MPELNVSVSPGKARMLEARRASEWANARGCEMGPTDGPSRMPAAPLRVGLQKLQTGVLSV